ncbi:MAG: hypothetical protein NZ959_01360 [Armatimonadetes bacterium]|nr:hypothetical protein [Armatimonadota bacterium]MDW8122105.1 hypothetical protein [Armatimonadota bacterium]
MPKTHSGLFVKVVGVGVVLMLLAVAVGLQGRGDVDVSAQRVSSKGELVWGEERSRTVASSKLLERRVAAVPDGAGGAIVVFEVEWTTGERAGDTDIFAQRMDSEGRLLWHKGERSVFVAFSELRERSPIVVPDGAGGAIVVFEVEWPRGTKHAGDIDIFAQRVSGDGKLVWGEEQSVPVASSPSIERAPTAVSDGDGGAIIFFELVAREGDRAGDVEIAAQRLSKDGKLLWLEGKRSVLTAFSSWGERAPVALPDGKGGAFVFFEMHEPK